jgi:uncharacterized protein (DUF2062 family)
MRFPHLRSWLEQLLHTHDTPHRTALAYALGVFLGFSPMLGLHAVLGLALAFVFRLNRVAVILGVYSNLPWVLPAYYTLATLAGAAILGVDVQPKALEESIGAISSTSWRHYSGLARSLAPLIGAFVLGSTIGAAVLAAVAYRAALVMILAHRKRISQRIDETG